MMRELKGLYPVGMILLAALVTGVNGFEVLTVLLFAWAAAVYLLWDHLTMGFWELVKLSALYRANKFRAVASMIERKERNGAVGNPGFTKVATEACLSMAETLEDQARDTGARLVPGRRFKLEDRSPGDRHVTVEGFIGRGGQIVITEMSGQ